MTEDVDERSQDEHVQDRVHAGRDEPGPDPEQRAQQRDADDRADPAPGEHGPVEPIVLDVRRELPERLGVPGFPGVVVGVEDLEPPEAEQARAVRVALLVRERMVLSVNRHPLSTVLPGGQPEDRTEDDVRDGVDRERPVRERPVQVHRRREDGGLREPDGDQQRDRGVGGGQQSGALDLADVRSLQPLRAAGDFELDRITFGEALEALRRTALEWTNTSSPPPWVMKPKPFAAFNHFTFPVAMTRNLSSGIVPLVAPAVVAGVSADIGRQTETPRELDLARRVSQTAKNTYRI